MIIPFFIPHSGCPHQCVFCNQRNITGQYHPDDASVIPDRINRYLSTHVFHEPVEIAFYGGSFTALSLEVQQAYLETVRSFIQSGRVRNIRLSTRPDSISKEIATLLKEHHVTVIELGAQSMDDAVLISAGRGHTADDTINAVKLLKGYGFAIGLQLMPGLPGDTINNFLIKTIDTVIQIKPDFVRLYPVLVIKGTPLEKLYTNGSYQPLTLDEAVSLCRDAVMGFEQAGINVIRIGLQSTEKLEKPGTILAGPFHPALGQLVESSIFLERMRTALKERKRASDTAKFLVNPKDVSTAVGQRRGNIKALMKEFKLEKIRVVEDRSIQGKKEMKLSSTRF